ncbi:MAG TPA: agmatinase [Gemmatimonadota bacterium]|nr:agmatinase [Gemmatimonadota bacterium]
MRDFPNFLGLTDEETAYEGAAGVVVPVPYERTVSYGAGAAKGPAAILAASAYVELYDEVLREEPWQTGGIHTAEPVAAGDEEPPVFLDRLRGAAAGLFADGKFPVFLGGEHTITCGPLRAARDAFDDLSVLQLDAHADLRDEYEGTIWSHACVMRRVFDLGIPAVPVGIRAVSIGEAEFIREHDLPVFWSHRIAHGDEWMETALTALSDTVYLTFDIDYFDPSLMPATGTPEPGGGFWHETLRFLGRVFMQKRVIGMDVVELAPVAGLHAPDFVAARLVHRCLGYRFHDWS